MPSSRRKGEARRSQLITTYGVGAIIALEDESFMVAGIDRWDAEPDLFERRLQRELNVSGFVQAPATETGHDVPVVRFPRWAFCPGCHRLESHLFFTTFDKNHCQQCELPLVPSRFVVACDRGHIADFPYFAWVHRESSPLGKTHAMEIAAVGATASLSDIKITCKCEAKTTMDSALDRFALRDVVSCTGERPWLSSEPEHCTSQPRALQRGASNVWSPLVRSSLSIPPWSEGAYLALDRYWNAAKYLDDAGLRQFIEGLGLTKRGDFTVDDLVLAAKQRRAEEEAPEIPTEERLRFQEYEALSRGREEDQRRQDFVAVPAGNMGPIASEWFDRVMLVKRLREVRVLEAFTRIVQPGPATPRDKRAPLFDSHPGWLPAFQISGEGVFIRLNAEKLVEWENRAEVVERAGVLNVNYGKSFFAQGREPDRTITPRLIMIHTLAHALITQWSLDSGYAAGSLRERLYGSDEMCGLLIYTATSDSAGSLGGVVAQGEGELLEVAVGDALMRSAWCSSDPLCIESDAAGVDALNWAACHACALLPEVSCEELNSLLDRGLLVGAPEAPTLGFFSALLGDQ